MKIRLLLFFLLLLLATPCDSQINAVFTQNIGSITVVYSLDSQQKYEIVIDYQLGEDQSLSFILSKGTYFIKNNFLYLSDGKNKSKFIFQKQPTIGEIKVINGYIWMKSHPIIFIKNKLPEINNYPPQKNTPIDKNKLSTLYYKKYSDSIFPNQSIFHLTFKKPNLYSFDLMGFKLSDGTFSKSANIIKMHDNSSGNTFISTIYNGTIECTLMYEYILLSKGL